MVNGNFMEIYILINFFVLCFFLAGEIYFLKQLQRNQETKKKALLDKYALFSEEDKSLCGKVEYFENKMSEYFFFYDLTIKLSPLIDKNELLNVFFEEIKHFGDVERVDVLCGRVQGDCLEFRLGEKNTDVLSIKTKSKKIIEYLPYFITLLKLCVERIDLYEKLQQLSIYDTLVNVYNRRYFLQRFFEEFERSQKLNLSLSFLMIDVDYFKRVNDMYGHLVGDVALREIAKIIRENVREIDLVARFGGEEFVVMLPETDKAGAIMVAERISTKVSQERIHAFDEVITLTLSVGIASYPHNTLYPDVLIEIADRAVYKAKISGRNRVSWF